MSDIGDGLHDEDQEQMTASPAPDARSMKYYVAGEVRAHVARRRISQAELALALGETQQNVSRKLTGTTAFSLDDLARIAVVLDVHPAVFLGGHGSGPFPDGGAVTLCARQDSNLQPSDPKSLLWPVGVSYDEDEDIAA